MKRLLFLPFIFLFTFCNCKKELVSKQNILPMQSIISECPPNGICTIEILRNKSLDIKTDDIGANYYTLIDNSTTSVIRYQYNKNVPKDLQDGQHREEIVFEINNETKSLNLKDLDLQKTKMLFGRLCYCRGQTGYYKVTSGNLKLDQLEEIYTIDLNFKVTQVPQLYNTVQVSVK